MRKQRKDKTRRSWNKYETEQYYIESKDLISLRSLAELAGRGTTTLAKWSKAGNWVLKRSQYWADVKKATREKSISCISDVWSQEAEELAKEHLEHHKKVRKFAEMLLDAAIETASTSENPVEVFRKLKIGDLNYISQISDRAVKGERDASGLPMAIDLNAAIRALQAAGYAVIDPSIVEKEKALDAEWN